MQFANHNHPSMGFLVRPLIALSLAFALCASRPASALDTGDIVVASIKGEVHIAIRGTEKPMRAGSVLELPATVRTGRDGAVELRQGATSISVGPETLLEFPALTTPGGSIDRIVQPRGTSFYNVGKRGGRKLRIETPFLVGVVKGTQFSVVAQDHATTISLFEGLLEVRSADDSDVVELHAGEIAARDRAATDISVLKMEAGATPPAPKPTGQRPPAGAGGNTGSPGTPRPTDNVVGDPFFAGRDEPVAVSLTDAAPGATRVDAPANVEIPAGNGAATVDLGVNAGSNGGSVEVGVGIGAGQVAVDVDLGLDDDENDNSGPGNSGKNGNHGNGNNGNHGNGNNGNGNGGPAIANDLAAVVDTTDIAVDVGVGLGNTQVNLGADLGAVTDIDLGLDDDDSDNSGPGSDNSGSGNSGSGSDNSGSGSDNSGPGNLVEDLLGGLTRRSGKK